MILRSCLSLFAVVMLCWTLLGSAAYADSVSYGFSVGELRAQIAHGTNNLYENPAFIAGETEAQLISGRDALELLDTAGYAEAGARIEDFPVIQRVLRAEGAIAVHLPSHAFPERPEDSSGLLYIPAPTGTNIETGKVFACKGIFLQLSRKKVFESECNWRICDGSTNPNDPKDSCNGCICKYEGCTPTYCAKCNSGSVGPGSFIERVLELCRSNGACDPTRFLDPSIVDGSSPRPL